MTATGNAAALSAVRQQCASGEARRIREQSNLSEAEIAADVGVADATVHRWETCERTPRGEAAVRYGALLRRLAKQLDRARTGA